VGGNRAVASGRGFGNITARSRMGRTGEAIWNEKKRSLPVRILKDRQAKHVKGVGGEESRTAEIVLWCNDERCDKETDV
jgi:hypothetical protein